MGARLNEVYRHRPALVQRKAEALQLLLTGLGLVVVVHTLAQVALHPGNEDWGSALAIAPGLALAAGFLWRRGLEAAGNTTLATLALQCALLFTDEVSRAFFVLCFFSMMALAVVAVARYQRLLVFSVFPLLVVAKGGWEFHLAAQGRLTRATEIETVVTLGLFVIAIPLIVFVMNELSHETERNESLLDLTRALSHEAGIDPLTGAWNRRSFARLAARETADAERLGRGLGLVLLDLDHFKEVNDRWGHAAGDEVLKTAVQGLRLQLREGDSLVRWGGDEFVALLPGVAEADLAPLGEKLRRIVAETRLLADHGVSASLGVTQWIPGEALEVTLERADRALYQAKAAGRNRVVVGP